MNDRTSGIGKTAVNVDNRATTTPPPTINEKTFIRNDVPNLNRAVKHKPFEIPQDGKSQLEGLFDGTNILEILKRFVEI